MLRCGPSLQPFVHRAAILSTETSVRGQTCLTLMQRTSRPRVHQITDYVEAVQRIFPKAAIQIRQIGTIQNR